MPIDLAVSGTELDATDGIEVLIDLANSCGVKALELWYPKNFAKDGVSATVSKLSAAKLEPASVSTSSRLYGSQSEEARGLLRHALSLASQLGARFINTYFGHSHAVADQQAIEQYRSILRPILDDAASRNITITLENEFDFFGTDPRGTDVSRRPEALEALFEAVSNDRFKLNFDAANFLCASVTPREAYGALSSYVAYMHVKDVRRIADLSVPQSPGWRRYSDSGFIFESTRLGEGDVGWHALLQDVQAAGYDGYLALEPHCSRPRLMAELIHSTSLIRAACGQA